MMVTITREHVIAAFSGDNQPAAYADSGSIIEFFTRDCYDDAIISLNDINARGKIANPATGPLYINQAEVGDILKVQILGLKTAPTGIMRTAVNYGGLKDIITEREMKFFNLVGDTFPFDNHLSLRKEPMIGVIGTAPAQGLSIGTDTPGEHGGNMDCRLIQEGSILYLPVNVKGALLALGDLHALMADGEILICGIECRGKVTLQVDVIKEPKLPTPFLCFNDEVMTIQSALTLDEAASLCAYKLHEFIMKVTSLSVNETGMLMSLKAHLIICQVVDPLKTVRMSFPLKILQQYGFKLP